MAARRRRERRRKTRRRETRVRLQPIRVDVEADRRSQHRIYNQHDCLTPHNQRPYPYYAGSIVASPFVLPLPARAFLLFLVPKQATPRRSFHVDITWDPLLFSPLFSRLSFLSHHLFGYLLGPLPLRAGPHYPDHDSKWDSAGQGRNGHGYIIRDRNNARFSFFFTRGPPDRRDVALTLSVKTMYVAVFVFWNLHVELRYVQKGSRVEFACNFREKLCNKKFYSLLATILFSKLPKRKSYQFHVVTRHYIFIFMMEFLTRFHFFLELSSTYVRFRKQSRDDERRRSRREETKERRRRIGSIQ